MSTKKKHKKAAGTILFYNVKEENELIHIENIKNKNSISKGINILFLETPGDRLDLPKGVADSIILKSPDDIDQDSIEDEDPKIDPDQKVDQMAKRALNKRSS